MCAGNVNLNMDLVRMRGSTLQTFEDGKPILLKIRSIMPYVEKAKSIVPTPIQTDRSALSRNTDDKLAKVITAIEVFTTEIQAIIQRSQKTLTSLPTRIYQVWLNNWKKWMS